MERPVPLFDTATPLMDQRPKKLFTPREGCEGEKGGPAQGCGTVVKTYRDPMPCYGGNNEAQSCGQQVTRLAMVPGRMPVLTPVSLPPMPATQWVINLSNQYQVKVAITLNRLCHTTQATAGGEDMYLQKMTEKMNQMPGGARHHHHHQVICVSPSRQVEVIQEEEAKPCGEADPNYTSKAKGGKKVAKASARAKEVISLAGSRMTKDERKRHRWGQGEWWTGNTPTSSDEDTPGYIRGERSSGGH